MSRQFVVVVLSQYLFDFFLLGYFSSFILPLTVFFFQPSNVVMGVVALAFCFFKRHVLKKYRSRFKRLNIVFLSQQRIGYHILFPLLVGYVIGHILYFQCPPCLMPVSYLGLVEVGQIFVIHNNLGPDLRSFRVLSPLLNCLDYCQHLFLNYGIVLFCACHFL